MLTFDIGNGCLASVDAIKKIPHVIDDRIQFTCPFRAFEIVMRVDLKLFTFQRLFDEFRGEPEADRAAIVEALVALARVGAEEPGLRSADLNPLILVDGKPVAVDALLEIDEEVADV